MTQTRQVIKLNDILAELNDTHEKTAEDGSCPAGEKPKEDAKSKVVEALKDSESKDKSTSYEKKKEEEDNKEKTASPAQDLQKIANDIAQAEEEARTKEAQLYGAAVADGFLERISQYEKAASEIGQPTSLPISSLFQKEASSEQMYHDDEGNLYTESQVRAAMDEVNQEKYASNQNDVYVAPEAIKAAEGYIKEAADQGFQLSEQEAFEKVAEEAALIGYNQMMEKAAEVAQEEGNHEFMEKAAEEAYQSGFTDTLEKAAQVLREAGNEEAVAALEKVAFETGYEDAMEKIATGAWNQGIADFEKFAENNLAG